MSRLRIIMSLATAAALLPACGDGTGDGSGDGGVDPGDDGSVDAAPRPCWPFEGSTPGGEVEVGTGNVDFMPMPASIPFVMGGQGGTFLYLDSRIRGLEPGDPTNVFAARNPKTRFQVILGDGTVVGYECGGTVGYHPAADGYFDRAAPQQIAFLPYSLGEAAFNTEVRVIVEVIDIDGRYARDEKMVFATAPQ